ncbi:dTDP-4-dehydrorhamnose 3,5-epimerase [Gammaproteobacteria bacterium]|nr:dTDP-4-dehydrorhamnose 3,5-epimerase [Gammaproteobacteria bacterium]
MNIIETGLESCVVIEPEVYGDERGFFLETFQKDRYLNELKISYDFVQDNHSRSAKGVLRGLHFQKTKPQGKLVRVVRGEVFDVAVDIRKKSPTFGKHISVILNEKNKRQLWVPPGFAHGFIVLSDFADFEYKCTEYYDPDDEGSIIWNDTDLKIEWPVLDPSLSDKDKVASKFNELVF